jgi:hypothetical protein
MLPGFAPPAATPGEDGPIERPLTDAERAALRNSRRARLGHMTRVFGTLTGIVPGFLLLLSIVGTPYDPFNYTIIVLVASFLAVVLGGASATLRFPITAALKSGQVTEARGVPEKKPGRPGVISVDLDGLDLHVRPRLADRLLDGRMNEIAFVVAGPGGLRHPDRARAAVIAVNGEASAPDDAYLLVPPEVLKMLRPRGRGALARRG